MISGTRITITVPTKMASRGMGRWGMILWTGCPPTLEATYRLMPTGGVARPMHSTMTITTPTGEGVTSARTFVRLRRCVLVDAFRIV